MVTHFQLIILAQVSGDQRLDQIAPKISKIYNISEQKEELQNNEKNVTKKYKYLHYILTMSFNTVYEFGSSVRILYKCKIISYQYALNQHHTVAAGSNIALQKASASREATLIVSVLPYKNCLVEPLS